MTKKILLKALILLTFGISLSAQQTPNQLRVLTDANNYLLVSAAAQTLPLSQPTVFTNTRLKTDSNNYLQVVLVGGLPPSTYPLVIPASTCAAPSLGESGAATTGIAFTATPSILNCITGTAVTTLTGSSFTSTVPILAPDGIVTAPSISFSSNPDDGFFLAGADDLRIAMDNGSRHQWLSTSYRILSNTATILFGASQDTILTRDGAGIFAQRNGTSAQTFKVYNTYTSSTNNEAFSIDWQTTANVAIIGTRTAATGNGRQAAFVSQASNGVSVYAGLLIDRQNGGSVGFNRLGIFDSINGSSSTIGTTTGTRWVVLGEGSSNATTGTVVPVAIIPTYNQPFGDAANTDFLINRTQTAVGSNPQLLIDAQVNSATKWSVSNTGVQTNTGYVSGARSAYGTQQCTVAQVTLSGATSSTSSFIPAGATVTNISTTTTTTITGASGYQVGDGSDADRYGDITGTAVGTKSDSTSGTADPRWWATSARAVTLTAKTSNFTGGVVQVVACWLATGAS